MVRRSMSDALEWRVYDIFFFFDESGEILRRMGLVEAIRPEIDSEST